MAYKSSYNNFKSDNSKNALWYSKDHQAIALRHLRSAQCLFDKKMFLESFYIIGYVFEIAIQFELKRIGDLSSTAKESEGIFNRFVDKSKNINSKSTGLSIRDFLASVKKDVKDDNDLFMIEAVTKGKLTPPPEKNANEVSSFHDLPKLAMQLETLYGLLRKPNSDFCKKIDAFNRHNWSVSLRYNDLPDKDFFGYSKQSIQLAKDFLELIGFEFALYDSISEDKKYLESKGYVVTEKSSLSNNESQT